MTAAPRSTWVRTVAVALAMAMAAVLAVWAKPVHKISVQKGIPNLEAMIPQQFGDWRLDRQAGALVADPTVDQQLNKLYTALLTRTYINSQGQRVMLSIAYGEDQRDGMQVHRPEVCYPAQGFKVLSSERTQLDLGTHTIPVRHVVTNFANELTEPVTYWTTIGNQVTDGGREKKLIELDYAMKRQIPDGLLFRMSTRGPDVDAGFAVQRSFAQDLLAAVAPGERVRLAGHP